MSTSLCFVLLKNIANFRFLKNQSKDYVNSNIHFLRICKIFLLVRVKTYEDSKSFSRKKLKK